MTVLPPTPPAPLPPLPPPPPRNLKTPGGRFAQWLEDLGAGWSERLKGWATGAIGFGFEVILDVIADAGAKQLKPLIDKLQATGAIPPEIQPIINELTKPTGELAGLSIAGVAGRVSGGAVSKILDILFMGMAYQLNYSLTDPGLPYQAGQRPTDQDMIQLYIQHHWDLATLKDQMRIHGMRVDTVQELTKLWQIRLPSDVVLPAWLRDKSKYQFFVDELTHLGLADDQIALLKEMAYRIPGVQDVIRYVVKEAYNPEIVAEFGQASEYPTIAEADAEKAGVRPDMLLKEWIAHWDLPSVGQGFEMLHRGEITEDQLTKLLKAKDIMPFWRDKLTAISWVLPGRIEARMLAQYGLVDKKWLIDILEKDGLAAEYRDVVADMMLVRGARTDIQTRYAKKWLDAAGVRTEITKLNLSPQIADRLYQWIVTNAAPDRTQTERDLTTAEIVKAVRLGFMEWADGVALLMAQGWDESEADLKLAIGIPTAAEVLTDDQKITLDTIRRRRRQRLISREEEVAALIALGLSPALANAHAANDDLRLEKPRVVVTPEVVPLYQTAEGKVSLDTIRLSRRQQLISRDEEITALMELEVPDELARSFADNDELRMVAVKPAVVPAVVPVYHTETGKAQVENIRLAARQRKLTRAQTAEEIRTGAPLVIVTGDEAREREIVLLLGLEMSEELAIAYADNDELRLVKAATGGTP